MFCGQNLSKKQECSLRFEKFQVKCWDFETATYFHSILLFLACFCFLITLVIQCHVFTGNVKLEIPEIYYRLGFSVSFHCVGSSLIISKFISLMIIW